MAVGEPLPGQPFQELGKRVEMDDVQICPALVHNVFDLVARHVRLIGMDAVGDLPYQPVTSGRVIRVGSDGSCHLNPG